ncbi:MAG: glycosyltransferase [Candidatus Fermentibacteraceae bacterium]|nr:glycosyltransferase [Candidatus Fermentibacteraceae bacterium]MBN2609571.1 glycosyltransferase [Candidatus Fermentibacteraceae bacterium]
MPGGNIRILHIITKLAVGGAQLNTLISTRDVSGMGLHSDILTGPEKPPEGELFDLGNRWGLNIITAPHLKRDISPVRDLLALLEIRRTIRDGDYDIVHTHGSKARFLGRIAAASFPRVRIVQTAHGWPFYESMNPLKKYVYITLEKIGFDLAHFNICVSPRDRDKALSYGIGHFDDFRIIRSGVEFDDFRAARGGRNRARDLLGIDRNAEVVGSVMRFCPEKAPDVFVAAATRILDERPGTKFVLVGDGPLFEQTRHLIRTRKLADSFLLTGSRDDVVEILPAFDVFLITSRTEGLPRALLESLAAGVPVVSTDVGGIHELLKCGRNGILCGEGDVGALSEGVCRLLDDPGLRSSIMTDVDIDIEPFSAETMVKDLYELYTRIAEPGMNVVFLCDDEPFNIPRTVAKVIRKQPFNRYTVVSLSGHGSLRRPLKNIRRYMGLYGLTGFFLQLARFAVLKLSATLRLPTRDSHSLRQTAKREHADYASLDSVNSGESRSYLNSLDPDVFISIACPQILRKGTLSIPRKGAWNIHSSMLPKNRGMLPTFWSLYNGDQPGVTMHRMVPELDAGEILIQRKIERTIDNSSLHQLLDLTKDMAADIAAEGLELIRTGAYRLQPNPVEKGSENSFPCRTDVKRFIESGGRIAGSATERPLIAISFDVEEWFQTYAARKWYPYEAWTGMNKRVNTILDTILEILSNHRSKGTFFFLGWIAEHHPELLMKVVDAGHEVGYHGYNHIELNSLSRDEFHRNLDRFEKIIESVSIPMPVGFRAPSFSMKANTLWAVDEIISRGFQYDSSVYPMFKIRYGTPRAPQKPFLLRGLESSILELPLASLKLAGMKIPVAGGAYMRFYPGFLHRLMLGLVFRSGNTPVLYFHPWEIDSMNISSSMSMFQKIRQHHNSGSNTIFKLRRILRKYRGIALRELADNTDPGNLTEFSL